MLNYFTILTILSHLFFRKGLNAHQAEFTVKKYKSHHQGGPELNDEPTQSIKHVTHVTAPRCLFP